MIGANFFEHGLQAKGEALDHVLKQTVLRQALVEMNGGKR